MVRGDGEAQHTAILIDFSLSAQVIPGGCCSSRLGTLLYTAPEVLVPDQTEYDERVDLYSLGVIAYEAITGKPPFIEEKDFKR